jgi:hypothetical protein
MLRKDRQLGALAGMQKKQKDSQKKADWDSLDAKAKKELLVKTAVKIQSFWR